MITNWNEIFIDLTTKADNSDDGAIKLINDHFINNRHHLQDFNEELVNFYKKGAKENKPYSLYQLANMYYCGNGVKEDLKIATKLIKKSMKAGCSQAYVFMGALIKYSGAKCDLDFDTLMDKALEMNNSNALVEKAIAIYEEDREKCIELLKKAIELGNIYGIYKLGELYHNNDEFELAMKYYELAIEKENAHAYFNLAVMYRDGEGTKANIKKALELFAVAHELGSERAMVSIGGIYQDSHNIPKAKKCYLLAVKKNSDPIASFNLATIYKDNDNHKKAIKYFLISARQGHMPAQHILVYDYNVTKSHMTDEEINKLLLWHHKMQNFGAYDGFLSR